MTSDAELLDRYASEKSQAAFTELCARYLNLVYASARRQSGNGALAEDITQAVFLMLAQKAAKLRKDVILSAWLLTATWYATKNALRKERRRQIYEQRAAEMNIEITSAEASIAALDNQPIL